MNNLKDLEDITLFNLPKLFEEKFTSKMGAVIRSLECGSVTYSNRLKSEERLSLANSYLTRGKIETDHELRMIMGSLIESDTYLRIIGSCPTGSWLATSEDEVDANATNIARWKTSTKKLLKNGVGINLLFTFMNEFKDIFLPVHNQTRHQFNSEKPIIKRKSDDLIDKNNEV